MLDRTVAVCERRTRVSARRRAPPRLGRQARGGHQSGRRDPHHPRLRDNTEPRSSRQSAHVEWWRDGHQPDSSQVRQPTCAATTAQGKRPEIVRSMNAVAAIVLSLWKFRLATDDFLKNDAMVAVLYFTAGLRTPPEWTLLGPDLVLITDDGSDTSSASRIQSVQTRCGSRNTALSANAPRSLADDPSRPEGPGLCWVRRCLHA